MGPHPRRPLRRALLFVVAMCAALALAPSAASAATSYDRLANVTHTSVASGGGLGLQLGTIQIVRGVSITGVKVNLSGTRLRAAANLRLACVQGGTITGGGAGDINFTSSRNWSVSLVASTGPTGCKLAREFAIGPNADVKFTLKSQDGVLYILLDGVGTLKTTVPGLTAIDLDAHIGIGGGAYDISVEGGIPGVSAKGAIASNGAFEIKADLEGLQLGGAKIGANVRLARATGSSALQVSIGASLDTNLQILPGLNLLAVKLGLDNNSITIEGTIRVACERGSVDATAIGRIQDLRNFSLDVKGVTAAQGCGFGNFIRLQGQTISGKLAIVNGLLLFDAQVGVDRVNLGELPLTRNDSIGVFVDDAKARITNSCDGCPANQLRIEIAGKGTIAVKLGFLPQKITVGAGLKGVFAIDLSSFALKRLSIQLTSLSLGTLPKAYAPLIQQAIEQGFDEIATTPPTTEGVTAAVSGGPLLTTS
ncbi:MAG: hypothetical protein JHC95_19970 [Solirubrobacteraceae bacterium]|nr:hypothetical protein [Solirubrobacteraceae bacterium]